MDIAAVASSLNVLGLIGFGFLVKGLKERIDNLTSLAKEQKETLEAVRERAAELDQLRKDYRQGVDDFLDLGKKLNELRSDVVNELEQAIKTKDEQLARTKQRELDSLDRIPELETRLAETITELKNQITIVAAASSESPKFPSITKRLADALRSDTGLSLLQVHSLQSDDFSSYVDRYINSRLELGMNDHLDKEKGPAKGG